MIDLELIAPRAEIVGADGIHVGTVDHVDGRLIALNHCDTEDGRVRHISGEMVAVVEDGIVHLTVNAEEVVAFECADTRYSS